MSTKLTLQLNDNIIKKAKIFAKSHNSSLSRLVENFFQYLVEDKDYEDNNYSSIVDELIGIIRLEDDIDIKNEHTKYLMGKYT